MAVRAVLSAATRPALLTGGVVALHLVMAGLFACRRPERDRAPLHTWMSALPSLVLGALVTIGSGDRIGPLAAALFVLGALGAVASMLTLGRSFAVLPGARALVVRGPYRVVRHPMYASELLMFAALVAPLGAPRALVALVLAALALALRIRAEEHVLAVLPGHGAYRQQVPFRLVPGLW